MRLDHCTWPEVDTYLKRSTGILIPVGSTEQHGSNGLIGTDTLCAEAVAQAVAERVGGLCGPPLPIGVAEHHLDFAGSLTLSRETVLAVRGDYGRSLLHHGFRRLYVVNGHGGNIGALHEWSRTIDGRAADDGAALRRRFVNWWMGNRTTALRRDLYGDREGVHAPPSEIAVTQHPVPAAPKPPMAPGVAPAAQSYRSEVEYRAKFPDGCVASDPSLATPADGARLFATAVDDVAEDYGTFLASRTPRGRQANASTAFSAAMTMRGRCSIAPPTSRCPGGTWARAASPKACGTMPSAFR
ncbi:MAG: creatininase family protein [Alphaproteobacteria bacterium]|nr:creatininase family protein [Alphaproteobacteria bacterium]